jgi:outer membrane protein OmpA-like peptidoglycan-associated protein/tetratricopeptide (TPR) repeat protein
MNMRLLQMIIVMFLVQGTLMAQEDVKIRKKYFRTGVDIGFKEAWKSIREADQYYQGGQGTYNMARDLYLYANQYNPENAELNYKIGACYLFTDDKYEAINYLLKAYQLNEEVSGDINLLLGQAYHLVLEFDAAARHYNEHKNTLKGDELAAYTEVLAKRLAECQNGKILSQDPVRVIIQDLGAGVNSKFDEYNPVFASGDTALYFTSRRPFGKAKRNPLDNKYNEDIYVASVSEAGFEQAVRMEKPFNSENNDAVVGISSDGYRLFIYRGNIDNGCIQATSFNPEKGKWSKPKDVPRKLVSKDGETSACLSSDGKELYYVSRNEKLTSGGKDILVSRLDEKGKWQEPRNIGGLINTKYDEEGVFITPDGKYLYFASQGHNSMGGFDVFRSMRLENGAWSSPENLGYPINTPDDELFYITDESGTCGYYSAIREGGHGSKDIFKVIFLGSEKELVTAMHDVLVAGPGDKKTGFLVQPVLPRLDTSIVVIGRVLDTAGAVTPVVARLTYLDPNGVKAEIGAMSNDSGAYTVRLPEPSVYGVEINATGYLYFLDIIDLSGYSGEEKVIQDFYLKKIEVGTKVVLENIYFETGKAVLRPESFDALDQVLRFLENNPGIKLEISGHTDNTGSLRINQKLSGARAKAVVDYLVAGGIPAEMLVYQGYADTQPVAPNDTPEGREKNRRVEFKVLSK